MIGFDDSDTALMSFYNMGTLNPTSLEELNVLKKSHFDADEVAQLSTDEQFDVLNQLINDSVGNHQTNYDFSEEDNTDPLGSSSRNLVQDLLKKGVISSVNDVNLNKYLISSQNFDSGLYLSLVHQNSSIEQLSSSLTFLERNIENQASELKSVINDNFLNFIDSKKAIDEILLRFKTMKTTSQEERARSKVFNPQRSRKLIKSGSLADDLEESIKNLNATSSLMIRPVMEHRLKEKKLISLFEFISKHKFFFDLPSILIKHILNHDHTQFINDYNRFLKEKQEVIDAQESRYQKAVRDLDVEKDQDTLASIKIEKAITENTLACVFNEIDSIVSEYRKKIYKELLSMDHEVGLASGVFSSNSSNAKFINLVDKLYQLDNEEKATNPIFTFLDMQLTNLRDDLDHQTNKFTGKFTLMQGKLRNYISSLADHREGGSFIRYISEKYTTIEDTFKSSATTMSTPSNEERENIIMETFESSDGLDLSIINETWLILANYIEYLDDLFLRSVTKFVSNYLHYTNPSMGFNIDSEGKIRDKFFDLMSHANLELKKCFNNNEAVDQMTSSPESYETFLPHHTNSLSTTFYLLGISKKIDRWLTRIGEYATMIGNVSKKGNTNAFIKELRDSSVLIDQKILEAMCSVWVNDCSQFYDIENWEKYADPANAGGPVFTKCMKLSEYFETFMLTKLSQLVFDKQVANENNLTDKVRIVSSHPSKRMLVSLEIQFMRSMNVLVDSIMKKYNLEKRAKTANAQGDINKSVEKDLYKVMTMNNFDVLAKTIFPLLIRKFDHLYQKTLSTQNLKLYADIDKAALTIHDDILAKEKQWIQDKIFKHFYKVSDKSREKSLSSKLQIDGFVYEILVHFVKLVHVVKPLTGLEIFVIIIQDLQLCFLGYFLDSVRSIKENENFTNYGNLMLDIYFFVEIFDASSSFKLSTPCKELVKVIIKEINSADRQQKYSDKMLNQVLDQSLQDSEIEFTLIE